MDGLDVRSDRIPRGARVLAGATLLLGCALGARAAATDPAPTGFGIDQHAAFEVSQAAVGNRPGDYVLSDRAGRAVALSSYRGKPLLVNFVYTGCIHVCPTSSRALLKAVRAMRGRFGAGQFNVISIGFNPPTDSPAALREFAARQGIDDPNWELLSPRTADVAALAREFGFSYAPTPMGFDHTLQVSIVDADGRIRQQVYGDTFGPDSLGEPLKRLLTGVALVKSSTLSDFFDRIRILCSVYDPRTGKYRVDYSMYLEIAGGLTFMIAMLGFALVEWRARRALRTRGAPE